jgi:hypothetical protein
LNKPLTQTIRNLQPTVNSRLSPFQAVGALLLQQTREHIRQKQAKPTSEEERAHNGRPIHSLAIISKPLSWKVIELLVDPRSIASITSDQLALFGSNSNSVHHLSADPSSKIPSNFKVINDQVQTTVQQSSCFHATRMPIIDKPFKQEGGVL